MSGQCVRGVYDNKSYLVTCIENEATPHSWRHRRPYMPADLVRCERDCELDFYGRGF